MLDKINVLSKLRSYLNDVFYLKASFCMFLVTSAALVLFLLFFCLILKGEGSLPRGKKKTNPQLYVIMCVKKPN